MGTWWTLSPECRARRVESLKKARAAKAAKRLQRIAREKEDARRMERQQEIEAHSGWFTEPPSLLDKLRSRLRG